ncbi:hypothetical protein F0562_034069 [Nyssa sinensis]|uniref:tRNA synthetases class I catalytic domain-containing protein n=1 Tax=Nyssa sinensis TaxID=561372 RepID=A0A5J5AH04_9ASTE|nr:hypothetical protein F0562_034069 [Nyssa sinensis]
MAKRQEFVVYNSMTKQKKIFVPKVPCKVDLYVCGVTAYDLSHVGHARAYVAFDVLYRLLVMVVLTQWKKFPYLFIHFRAAKPDLRFLHHENEIAQSCAVCPESNVRYWIHNGIVTENGYQTVPSVGIEVLLDEHTLLISCQLLNLTD